MFLHDTQVTSSPETIDAATGETVWHVEREGFSSGWSTPTIVERGGRNELLDYGVWWLVAHDLADGAELWRAPGFTDEPITSPLTAGGLILVTSYNLKTNPQVEGLPTFDVLLTELDTEGNGTLNTEEIARNKSVLARDDADGDHSLRVFMRQMEGDRNGKITAAEWQAIVDRVDGFVHVNGVVALRPPALDVSAPKDSAAPQAEIVLVARDRRPRVPIPGRARRAPLHAQEWRPRDLPQHRDR